MTIEDVAKLTGVDNAIAAQLLSELKSKNVCSRTEDGTLYSRRIIRDCKIGNQKCMCQQCNKQYSPTREDSLYCSKRCKQQAYRNRNKDIARGNTNQIGTATLSLPTSYSNGNESRHNVTANVTDTAEKPPVKSTLLRMPRARARAPLARKKERKLPSCDPDYERDQPERPSPSKSNNAQTQPPSGPATALPDGRAGPLVEASKASKANKSSKRPHELTKAEFEEHLAKRRTGAP